MIGQVSTMSCLYYSADPHGTKTLVRIYIDITSAYDGTLMYRYYVSGWRIHMRITSAGGKFSISVSCGGEATS